MVGLSLKGVATPVDSLSLYRAVGVSSKRLDPSQTSPRGELIDAPNCVAFPTRPAWPVVVFMMYKASVLSSTMYSRGSLGRLRLGTHASPLGFEIEALEGDPNRVIDPTRITLHLLVAWLVETHELVRMTLPPCELVRVLILNRYNVLHVSPVITLDTLDRETLVVVHASAIILRYRTWYDVNVPDGRVHCTVTLVSVCAVLLKFVGRGGRGTVTRVGVGVGVGVDVGVGVAVGVGVGVHVGVGDGVGVGVGVALARSASVKEPVASRRNVVASMV